MPGGNTRFAYDELGRELQSIKTMNTTNYGVNRGYNALNNLLQVQYPDQKNIYYKYNGAGQIERYRMTRPFFASRLTGMEKDRNNLRITSTSAGTPFRGTLSLSKGFYLVYRISLKINRTKYEIRTTGRDTSDEIRDTRTVLSSFAS